MFTQLIFLILLLLLATMSKPAVNVFPFLELSLGYLLLLGGIVIQNKWLKKQLYFYKERILLLVSLELTAYLAFVYLIIGFPQFSGLKFTISVSSAFILYLTGIYIFHLTSFLGEASNRWKYAQRQILFLIPFAVPLFCNALLYDVIVATQGIYLERLSQVTVMLGSMTVMFVMIALLPPLFMKCWRCQSLQPGELRQSLEEVCRRANFRCRDMKLWTILHDTPTAAIIGIISPLRYVMFTKSLLNSLPKEGIKAVLAHEIGHSVYKHLWLLPLVLFGMTVSIALFYSIFYEGINQALILSNWRYPNFPWQSFALVLKFFLLAAISVGYIRFVFGFYSRLFERQADLYGLQLGMSASHLIDAFEKIAVITGGTREDPSWRHYSLGQRISFLEQVDKNPSLIQKHHHKVCLACVCYVLLCSSALCMLIAPTYSDHQPWKALNRLGQILEKNWTKIVTLPLRQS